MSDQKALLMINAKVNKANAEEVQSYLGQIMPVFAKNGGKPLVRYKTVQDISGPDSPEMTTIVEFPSDRVINEMVNSDEFTALSELRNRVFSKLNMTICEPM
jgi:uncharacterized protein (DUF1330 family)